MRAYPSVLLILTFLLASLHAVAPAQRDGSSQERALRSAPPDVSIRAHVENEKVVVGDRFRFMVSVHGAVTVQQHRAPSFTQVRELELVDGPSQEHRMIVQGPRSRYQTSYVYTLRATETGRVVIPPSQVRLNNVWYETDPVTVEIVDAPSLGQDGFEDVLPARTNRAEVDRQLRGRYFATIELPENIYRGQAVPIRLFVYRDPALPQFSRWELMDQPGGRDFVIPSAVDRRAMSQQVRWEPADVAGREFERTLVYTNYVVPTRTGTVNLEPPRLRIHIPADRSSSRHPLDDFISGRSSTVAAELPVRGRPLTVQAPPSKPAEAVAQFIGDASPVVQVDRRELPQRELLTLTLRVRGQGFFDLVSTPELPQVTNLALFDTQSRSESFIERGVLISEREYDFLFQATEAGETQIPELVFAVFNPRTGEQQLRRTDAIPVRIEAARTGTRLIGGADPGAAEPSRAEARVLGRDVAFIDTSPLTPALMGSASPPFYTRAWFWVLQLLVLTAALGYGTWMVWKRRSVEETEEIRLRRARRAAEEALASAEKEMNEAGREQFYAALKSGIVSYAASLLSRSEKGLTEEETAEALERLGYDEGLRDRLRRIWRDCDAIRYSPVPDTPDSRRSALEEARKVILSLEEKKSAA